MILLIFFLAKNTKYQIIQRQKISNKYNNTKIKLKELTIKFRMPTKKYKTYKIKIMNFSWKYKESISHFKMLNNKLKAN